MKTADIVSAVFGMIIKVAVSVVVIIFVYKAALTGYEFGYQIFDQQPMTHGNGRTVTVAVTENMSAKEMGKMLKENGLIQNTALFMAQYYLSEFREEVKPGIYDLSTSMTVEEMMEIMAADREEEESRS